MSRPLSAAMHKQSGPLIGQRDVAVAASQALGLISMLCFETGVGEHINKCFFWEAQPVWRGLGRVQGRGRRQDPV